MRVRWACPALCAAMAAAAFLVLTGLVATGATHAIDVGLLARLRPGDEWGPTQVRFSPWMSRLQPSHMFGLLTIVTAVAVTLRRSWRPLVSGVLVGVSTVALTTLVKLALERPDPHGSVPGSGGSFPSGHMAAVVACLAGCVVVLHPRMRWWHWVPASAGAATIGFAQLVSAAHWPSDLAGGALLALVVVCATRRVDPGHPSRSVTRDIPRGALPGFRP